VIENSLTVAQVYFNEHGQMLRSELTAMSFDVTRAKPLFDSDRERFRQFLTGQARVRGMPLTLMVHSDLSVVEKADIEGVGDIYGDIDQPIEFQALATDEVFKRLAIEKFHGDEGFLVLLADIVDGANVGMIQGGSCLCFALETSEGLRVFRDVFRKEF